MAKIPKTALKDKPQKCPICSKKFKNKAYLVSHIDKQHVDQIPKEWSASRYENYLRTGKDHGTCIICKENTKWNESTWKYGRLCDNPKCKKAVADNADKNNIKVYGKAKLLDDPDMQRKLVYSKKNSGRYQWTNDDKNKYENLYDSQVSKSFLEMLDVFMNFDPSDVFSPSPNTYPYKYEGEIHSYIPDHYIASLNLEVEIKEPKDNQNMHPKIQAVDKVKERLKDEAMEKRTDVNYIKINGTDYAEFFATVTYLKNRNDDKPNPIKPIEETFDSFENYRMQMLTETIHNADDYDSLLESANMVDEFMDELPITEASTPNKRLDNALINLDSVMDVEFDRRYTYKNVRSNFEIKLNKSETLTEFINLKMEAQTMKNELKSISKSEKGNNSYRYEAEKTIKYIDERIIPQCEYEIFKRSPKPIKEANSILANKNSVTYRPVFVCLWNNNTPFGKVIKSVTRQDYSHASLSLDTKLTKMMSFNACTTDGRRGFIPDETIYDEASDKYLDHFDLYMYIASLDEYDAMKKLIEDFKGKVNELSYSFKGVVNLVLNRETHDEKAYFCSEFVSKVISVGNPKLLSKDPSLYTPGDLSRVKKFVKLYSGDHRKYNEKEVDNRIKNILTKRGFIDVQFEY